MDKKQSLTPELKQIYERVMNTPLPASQTPTPQVSKPVATPPQPTLSGTPSHVVTPPVHPVSSPPPVGQSSATPPSPKISVHPAEAPVPAATNTFVFSSHGGAAAPGSAPSATAAVATKKGGLNPKIMVFAGIAFFLFYIGFWLKILHYF